MRFLHFAKDTHRQADAPPGSECYLKGTQPGDPDAAADEQLELTQRFTNDKERDDVFAPDLTVK